MSEITIDIKNTKKYCLGLYDEYVFKLIIYPNGRLNISWLSKMNNVENVIRMEHEIKNEYKLLIGQEIDF